jgi:hypothetical protein
MLINSTLVHIESSQALPTSFVNAFTIIEDLPLIEKGNTMNETIEAQESTKADKIRAQAQLLAAKMPNIFAASALSYSISAMRLAMGLGTFVKERTYAFSAVKEGEIEEFIESFDVFPIVTNATRINARAGYVIFGEDYPILGLNTVYDHNSATLEVFGDKTEVNEFHKKFKERFPNNTFKVDMVDSISESHGVRNRTQKIELADINAQTRAFYPWFDQDFDEYYDAYFQSTKNVLLIIGEPGLGKTTFSRNMLKRYFKETMLANNATLFKDSRLFEHFAGSEAGLLLIEDADNAVMARSEGNEGMSYLLNLTDGIIPLKKKIVIVTNLPSINKVDPALIRPGRCYDILEFRSLTAEQAEAARASIDMPYLDLTAVKSKWSLAEALNYDLDLKLAERKKTSIGFTS